MKSKIWKYNDASTLVSQVSYKFYSVGCKRCRKIRRRDLARRYLRPCFVQQRASTRNQVLADGTTMPGSSQFTLVRASSLSDSTQSRVSLCSAWIINHHRLYPAPLFFPFSFLAPLRQTSIWRKKRNTEKYWYAWSRPCNCHNFTWTFRLHLRQLSRYTLLICNRFPAINLIFERRLIIISFFS